MNHKQQIADTAKKIIERNGVCEGNNCTVCPCGSNVSGTICKIDNDTDEESDEAVKICKKWLIDNGYDAQQQEVITNKLKEIKFQDRTRGGYEYIIYTRNGKNPDYPIVGEYCHDGVWYTILWAKNSSAYPMTFLSVSLIPIEPAELEGLKIGDKVWSITDDGEPVDFTTCFIGTQIIWAVLGEIKVAINIDGSLLHIGNSKQMFYRSKERALASIREGNNVD